MGDDTTFSMAVRTGNWGRLVMLPFHKPVSFRLAPADEPGVLLRFESGLVAVPDVLYADEVDRLVLRDGRGRILLRFERTKGRLKRGEGEQLWTRSSWELRLESKDGVLIFYSRDGRQFPSDELLDDLAGLFVAPAATE